MTTINVRVDEELKKEVDSLYKELGLTMSMAINLFLKRCLLEKGIPFDLKLPSPETKKVMEEVEEKKGLSKEFSTAEELLSDLHA